MISLTSGCRDEPNDGRDGNLGVAEKFEVHILFGVVPRLAD